MLHGAECLMCLLACVFFTLVVNAVFVAHSANMFPRRPVFCFFFIALHFLFFLFAVKFLKVLSFVSLCSVYLQWLLLFFFHAEGCTLKRSPVLVSLFTPLPFIIIPLVSPAAIVDAVSGGGGKNKNRSRFLVRSL